eukprot:Seg5393.2 transcript_id=Seg5393.2/GoldUCD/mRNA.D3Y31 product="hypothetical protein" protein_id=Seg5393.2/GoldUCD/D3Y31
MRGVWNGDCDLGNGDLQRLRAHYDQRKKECKELCMVNHESSGKELAGHMKGFLDEMETVKRFLLEGLNKAKDLYKTKFNAPNTPEETLKALNWEIAEFQTLLQQCQAISSEGDRIAKEAFHAKDSVNIAKRYLNNLFDDTNTYITNVFKKRRQTPADHVLAILLSDEKR